MPRERVEEPGTGAIGSSRTQETTHVQIFARDDIPLVILVRVAMYQCRGVWLGLQPKLKLTEIDNVWWTRKGATSTMTHYKGISAENANFVSKDTGNMTPSVKLTTQAGH